MIKLKILIYLFIGIFFVNLANAALIHGTIYDLSLKKLNNVVVEIDTSPKQFIVAQNGSYSFNVPKGEYTIKALLLQNSTVIASVVEEITVKQDGTYVLDLILFSGKGENFDLIFIPNVEEGIENVDINLSENIIEGTKKNKSNVFTWLIIILILIVIVIILFYFKNKAKNLITTKAEDIKIEENQIDNDLEQIIKIIKQEGGRTTQKEIRKQIPLSEAKISLMIAELEHKGIVEKIKKGRGNIIILKKK